MSKPRVEFKKLIRLHTPAPGDPEMYGMSAREVVRYFKKKGLWAEVWDDYYEGWQWVVVKKPDEGPARELARKYNVSREFIVPKRGPFYTSF